MKKIILILSLILSATLVEAKILKTTKVNDDQGFYIFSYYKKIKQGDKVLYCDIGNDYFEVCKTFREWVDWRVKNPQKEISYMQDINPRKLKTIHINKDVKESDVNKVKIPDNIIRILNEK